MKNKPKFVIGGTGSYWWLQLQVPKMRMDIGPFYTRRRDAKRAAFRAARLLGLSDYEIKYS